MKQNTQNIKSPLGFTLIELLVVISIMGVIASVFILNFNAQRIPRDLNIARNETITNARKVQSYTLSSKDSSGKAIKFYVITFIDGASTYAIGYIDQTYSYNLLDTVSLPSRVYTKLGSANDIGCAQVIFSSPFGKMFIKPFKTTAVADCQNTSMLTSMAQDPIQLSALSGNNLLLSLMHSQDTALTNFQINFYSLSGKIDTQ